MTLLQFHPPADNERGPAHLDGLIDGWMAMCGQEGIRFGIASHDGQVAFLLDAPDRCQRIVTMELANAFPDGRVEVVNNTNQNPKRSSRWLQLSPDVYPLKQHTAFVEGHSREAIDPLESLLEAIKPRRSGRGRTEFWLELLPHKRKEGEQQSDVQSFDGAEGDLQDAGGRWRNVRFPEDFWAGRR